MKPYAHRKLNMIERIFNYRLSRARRVVENAFGICASRFRVLRSAVEIHPDRMVKVVLAICALHNFLITKKSVYASTADFDRETATNASVGVVPGAWRADVEDQLPSIRAQSHQGRQASSAQIIRDEFKTYFVEGGEVEWQCRAFMG